jgi:hypothetical protein
LARLGFLGVARSWSVGLVVALPSVEVGRMIFLETEVWVECDRCGRAFGGPGFGLSVFPYPDGVFCVECRGQRRTIVDSPRVATSRRAVGFPKRWELKDLGGA